MKHHGIRNLAFCAAVAAAIAAALPAHAAFEGFGKDIPLDSAARQIVPEGWNVEFADGVDQKAAVSWQGAADWQGALRAAVARKGYSAEVGDRNVRIVKAAAPRPAPQAAAAPRPYSSSPAAGAAQKRGGERQPVRAPQVQEESYRGGGGFSIRPYNGGKAGPGTMVGKGDFEEYRGGNAGTFSVDQGQMLHPLLAGWAAAAGWNLVWNSEYDYRIEAKASFGGDFIDAVTALASAMSDARPTITVDFYKGNRVVVISNKSSDEAN